MPGALHYAAVAALLFLAVIVSQVRAAEDEHGHAEGSAAAEFEFKALLHASSHQLSLVWAKSVSGDGHSEHSEEEEEGEHPQFFLVEVGDGVECGEEQLELAEATLEEMLEQLEHLELNATECEPGNAMMTPGVVDIHSSQSIAMFPLVLSASNCTAIFARHALAEEGLYMFNATSGGAVVFAYEEAFVEPKVDVSSIAGTAIGGAIVVCIVPIMVIILCLPFAALRSKEHLHLVFHFLNAFGCGALISVVALHIYPEMTLVLQESNEPAWKGGSMVLGGITAVAIIHVIADRVSGKKHDPEMGVTNGHSHGGGADVEAIQPAAAGGDRAKSLDYTSATSNELRMGSCRDVFDFKSVHPLVWGLTIGDALHNFVDGTIIATAFLVCGTSGGWITVGATIAHEVPQELGDFAVMISMGATVGQAIFFNLVAQSLAILGAGIVLGVGSNLPESQTGLLLAFGIGTFLFIALTDIMPLLLEVKTPSEYLSVSLGLLLAFAAIGLSTMGSDTCGHSH